MYPHPQCGQALNSLIVYNTVMYQHPQCGYASILQCINMGNVIYQHPQSGQCDVSSYNIHSLDSVMYQVTTSTVWTE